MIVRQAVFLVGGRGTRLGALAAGTPKPLLQISAGTRFLDLLIDNATRHGMTDILLLAGHLGGMVEEIYHGKRIRGARITVVREPAPAGTGGALHHAARILDHRFLLANGDSYFDINLGALTGDLPEHMLGRIALRWVPDVSRYGSVEFRHGRITAFVEKGASEPKAGLISGGMYLLDRGILNAIPRDGSIENDVFPALARRNALQGQIFDGYFIDIGLPEALAQARRELPEIRRRSAVYFDRDGVLNIDHGHTHRPEQLVWVNGARQAIRLLNDLGFFVFVVTNQAGVARGYYSVDDVHAFHAKMQSDLVEMGAHVDAFYYCPFHPEAVTPRFFHPSHRERKPNPGMILRARREWSVRNEGSFLVGDKESDIEAAHRAGIPGLLFDGGDLLRTVQGYLADASTTHAPPKPARLPVNPTLDMFRE